MAQMLHLSRIDAPLEKVYKALTTSQGLAAWWTADSQAEPHEGTIAEFGFSKRITLFRMRLSELEPNARVVWDCLGDDPEWKGTRLTWKLSTEKGRTVVRFSHANWRSESDTFMMCNTTWGALLYRLKEYAEGASPGPLFQE